MAKTLSMVFGVVFVLVGLLGFIANPIVGSAGYFETNLVHNLVHLIIGVVLLLIATMAPAKSDVGLRVFGIIYLIVAVLGFVTAPAGGDLLGFITANVADHWLHVVLGIVLVAVSFKKAGAPTAPAASMPPQMQ